MAVDGDGRRGPPLRMRHIPPPPQRQEPPPTVDAGSLPEAVGDAVDIATDPGLLDLLGHAVESAGAVVEALGDLTS